MTHRRILAAAVLTAALAVPMASATAVTGCGTHGCPITHHDHSAPALQEGGGVLPGSTEFTYGNIKHERPHFHHHTTPVLQEGGGVLPGTTVFFYNIKHEKSPALQEGGGVLPGTDVFFYNIKHEKGHLHPGRLFH